MSPKLSLVSAFDSQHLSRGPPRRDRDANWRRTNRKVYPQPNLKQKTLPFLFPNLLFSGWGFQSKGEPSTSDSPFPYSSSANESDAISLGDEMSIGIVNFESHKGIYGLLGLCVIGTPASGLELECDRICFLLLGKTCKLTLPFPCAVNLEWWANQVGRAPKLEQGKLNGKAMRLR
ncbi:hypothetical protein CCACVL1_02918 [Corchorus capsularis]|uniref:Uncharacterized protein n=1 Tax=Corchorus capsularis TaxID=210143 RepID=A0A1R3K4W8_COCAP|nr:hypothetical protein CCACVL1_02918 [Corchorus capsularis]